MTASGASVDGRGAVFGVLGALVLLHVLMAVTSGASAFDTPNLLVMLAVVLGLGAFVLRRANWARIALGVLACFAGFSAGLAAYVAANTPLSLAIIGGASAYYTVCGLVLLLAPPVRRYVKPAEVRSATDVVETFE